MEKEKYSEDDKFSLVEKIIKDIHNIMYKSSELNSFDIVPVEANFTNKSPVLHIRNYLGLESWCIKHVYLYCYSEIMDKYFSKSKNRAISTSNSDRISQLLNVTLLINPELNSLWNKRREMVIRNFLDKSSELQFTKIVLSRKPKCNEAFTYRRWLLDMVLADTSAGPDTIDSLINEELSICSLASGNCPNNYHSWNHRMWLVNKLIFLEQLALYCLYIREYLFSEKWTSVHVSDYSCFHYRQFCIKNILSISKCEVPFGTHFHTTGQKLRQNFIRLVSSNLPADLPTKTSEADLALHSKEHLVSLLFSYDKKDCDCESDSVLRCMELYFYELQLCNELIRFYKHHETLWYHRRFIIHELIAVINDFFGLSTSNKALVRSSCDKCSYVLKQKQAKMIKHDSVSVKTSVIFNVIVNHEKRFINERRQDGDNYSDRHEKYLKFVEGINVI